MFLITSLSVLKIRLDSFMVNRGDEARDLFVLDLAHRLNGVEGERSVFRDRFLFQRLHDGRIPSKAVILLVT